MNIGLVGCGLMGGHYADVFQRMDDIALVACCDPTPAKLESFSKAKGIPRSYVDYRRMLAEEPLDGFLNVTPDFLHAEVAEAGLKTGIPLMTEKPLGASLEECRTLLETARKSGAPQVMNFSKRHAAAVETARVLISGGVLGTLTKIEAFYLQGWVFTKDWGDWRDVHAWTWRLNRQFAPLGVLADLGSHVVDLLRHITGRNVALVSGAVMRTIAKGVESVAGLPLDSPDFSMASLLLDGDLPVSFRVSRIDAGRKDDLIINIHGLAARATINLSRDRRSIDIIPNKPLDLPEGCLDPGTNEPMRTLPAGVAAKVTTRRPKTNYQYFAEILRGGSPQAPDMEDGFVNQAVLEAISESSENQGTPIRPAGLPG